MKDSYVLQFNKWFIANGIINDHVINNLILFIMSFDPAIKDVKIFVPSGEKSIGFLIFLSRWNYVFKSKKIYIKLKEALTEYLQRYKVDISFEIYKKGKVNGNQSTQKE